MTPTYTVGVIHYQPLTAIHMLMTAGQIAGRLGRPDSLTAERIKHWIKLKLLRPLGARNPGTGRHLTFNEFALIDAFVLTALADHGIRLAELHRDLPRETRRPSGIQSALNLCRMAWRESVVDPDLPLFLMLACVMDPYKRRPVFFATVGSTIELREDALSATVLDLRRLFRPVSWDPEEVEAARSPIPTEVWSRRFA
jgi:hypothetical protein